MRVVFLVGLALIASTFAEVSVPKYYHDEIGIPEAARIKALEDEILAKQYAASATHQGRIVGGVAAPINSNPHLGGLIISLENIAGNSVCGSSLVSPNRLVTAAHCWFDGMRQAWQFVVVLGSNMLFSGGSRFATSTVFMHPQYIPSLLLNDVAVIYLSTSVTFNNAIQAVSIPNTWELSDTYVGEIAVAAGYGRTSDLQAGISINAFVSQVNLMIISEAECRMTYPNNVFASTLCTSGVGGVGVCGGDSGGPLIVNRWGRQVLVGISSFAAQVAGQSACQRGHPSGFARVTSFHSFITQHL